jgi:CubicO group peptidase (beta-lactamase class C family)
VLERIIERVTGVSYEEYLQREIFAPLQLQSASVPHVATALSAQRYDGLDRPLPFYTLGHRGASSVYASAHDLVKFGIAHLELRRHAGPAILTRKSLRDMQRVQTPRSSTGGYGLGWQIEETRGGFRHVGHTGGMPGVTTVLSLYPSERVVVVVLTNARNPGLVRLAQQVAGAAMPLYARELASAN